MQTSLSPEQSGKVQRRWALVALSLMAALLVPAAIALACGPNRQIQLDRLVYEPGQTATLTGSNYQGSAGKEITFRLEEGDVVAKTTVKDDETLRTSFQVPTKPGAYVVVGEGFDEKGDYIPGTPSRNSFEVRAPRQREEPPPQQEPQPGEPQEPTPGTGPGATGPRPGRASPQPRSPAESGQPRERSRSDSRNGRTGDNAPAPSGQRPRSGGATTDGPVNAHEGVIDGSGGDVFTGSVPRGDRVAAASGGGGAGSGSSSSASGSPSPTGAPPSERSASGDVWSGFGSQGNPSLLPQPSDPAVPGDGPGSGFGWGVALLALGLLTLVGSFGVSEVRRHRSPAR